ncbi:putative transcription factor interactor and regulator CCHC(Zn) family [Helianthus annuus]|nr:putative transcription factor interactor and regulator CCHC(Zn) family [Helianthus annuus]KAJ0738612.1 putative transcription factor interactor and regulator CCHC(Zn) family [Helianthus annuus]KAJ0912778.1 putative transcription factor interactor and regulator CCHC(Zn) family [Helianthus annuus]
MGHETKDCRSSRPVNQNHQQQPPAPQNQQQHQQRGNRGCFQCGAEGHFKRDCPQLNQNQNNNNNNNQGNGNNNGGNNNDNGARGRVFMLGQGEARNDPNVVVRYSWSLHREARSLWDMAVCAMLKTLHYFILNTYIGFYNYASAKHLTTYLIWNTFHIVRLNFTYYLLCSI